MAQASRGRTLGPLMQGHWTNSRPRDGFDSAPGQPSRQLTLFDSICIIVGIIIGAGIYRTTPDIASCVPSASALVAVWLLGGLLSLLGGLCYAELATTYPHAGGDYVFLTRAYGRRMGFLFAWSELWIVRPGSIGMMAFIFAQYARELLPGLSQHARADEMILAGAAISVLTLINVLGIREGKWTQNLLTTLKVLSLALIFLVGMVLVPWLGQAPEGTMEAAEAPLSSNFRLAMILVLFTYGGWNEMAYVAAEVKNPRRNILRALILGTLAVTAIYVLVTAAFVQGLGFVGVQQSQAVASDLLRIPFGDWGGKAIALIICVSVLGSMNGQILTGARVYYAMGRDHPGLSVLAEWHPQRNTPIRSLLIQGVISLTLIGALGWYESGFINLLNFTTPIFWTFFGLVGFSLFVLRVRDPERERPYRVHLFPLVPLIFCASCGFMIYSSVSYAVEHRTFEAVWAIAVLVIGAGVSLFLRSCYAGPTAAETRGSPEADA